MKEWAIPKNTRKSTDWATTVWIDWTEYRSAAGEDVCESKLPSPLINQLTKTELNYCLSHFVLEARRQNGYPPNTLYQICCGLQRAIHDSNPGWSLFTDLKFCQFCDSLDPQMKDAKSRGLGKIWRQAETITAEEENLMWASGVLGTGSLQALADSMFFLNGMRFGLKSGQEHRQLQWENPQLTLAEVPMDSELPFQCSYSRYTKDISKNNQGSIKMRKVEAKHVIQHGKCWDPTEMHCASFQGVPQVLSCKYCRPGDSFHLQQLKSPIDTQWFSNVAIGHNSLDKTVARMCKAAGINGYKTNHSLRVSLATSLLQSRMTSN